MNRRGLTPLVATVLLVVFALIIGAATMSWGQNYVGEVDDHNEESFGSSIVISLDQIYGDPLKELQIKYITDKITLEEYKRESERILAHS